MTTPAAPAAGRPVPSPCINVCRMDPAGGLCEGCLRSLDEIALWSVLDDEGKRLVWAQIEQRRAAAAPGAGAGAPAAGPTAA